MKRLLNPGKTSRGENIFVTVTYDGTRLSICGVVGPMNNGNCTGNCGQIRPIEVAEYASGWNADMVTELNRVWERWHLNDLRAGTPSQELHLRIAKDNGWKYSYEEACAMLKNAGLYEINGYKYGHSWLTEEIPQYVITFLDKLPTSCVSAPIGWSSLNFVKE